MSLEITGRRGPWTWIPFSKTMKAELFCGMTATDNPTRRQVQYNRFIVIILCNSLLGDQRGGTPQCLLLFRHHFWLGTLGSHVAARRTVCEFVPCSKGRERRHFHYVVITAAIRMPRSNQCLARHVYVGTILVEFCFLARWRVVDLFTA